MKRKETKETARAKTKSY